MEENTTVDISAVNEKIAQESAFIDLLVIEMNKVLLKVVLAEYNLLQTCCPQMLLAP